MIKKLSLSIIMLMLLIGNMFGQNSQTKDQFSPLGNAFAKIFTDFHTNFADGNAFSQFEVTRVYLGYKYSFNKYFSGSANLDVGNPGVGNLKMTAYLKNAYVQYRENGFTAKFGLIGTTAFSLQESQWGNRYLYKSFQDQNGFNPSADMGVSVAYRFNSMITADFSIFNGEGYKSLQTDSTFKYAAGLTFKPVKSLSLRVYYDYMNKLAAQQTLSLFLGYNVNNLKLGAEFNKQYNHGMIAGKDYSGYSAYATYKLKNISLFGRYDNLSSVTTSGQADPWNLNKDGQTLIAGIALSPVKGVKVSPNYQLWKPRNTDIPSASGAFLSLEIKF